MATQLIEVWEVEVKSKVYTDARYTYHVRATSATTAELKALKISRLNSVKRPYVSYAKFKHYIDA